MNAKMVKQVIENKEDKTLTIYEVVTATDFETRTPDISIHRKKTDQENIIKIIKRFDIKFETKPEPRMLIHIVQIRAADTFTYDYSVDFTVPATDDLLRLAKRFMRRVRTKTNENRIAYLTEKFLNDLKKYVPQAETYLS